MGEVKSIVRLAVVVILLAIDMVALFLCSNTDYACYYFLILATLGFLVGGIKLIDGDRLFLSDDFLYMLFMC